MINLEAILNSYSFSHKHSQKDGRHPKKKKNPDIFPFMTLITSARQDHVGLAPREIQRTCSYTWLLYRYFHISSLGLLIIC